MSSSAPSTPSVHFSRDTLDNNSTTNNSDADVVLKRRLAKALQVASNLKSKTLIEQEVNKELAKRNADVRAKNRALEKQVEDMKDMLMSIESAFAQLQQTTLEHVPENKFSIIQEEFLQFSEIINRAVHFSSTNPTEDPLKPKFIPQDVQIVPSKPRVKGRRQSMTMNIPEISSSTGTSLVRKSINLSSMSNLSMYISADSMSSMQFPDDSSISSPSINRSSLTPASPANGASFSNGIFPLTPKSMIGDSPGTPSSAQVLSNSMSNKSPFAKLENLGFLHSEQESVVLSHKSGTCDAPLFEHFLVIGATCDVATEFANQLRAMEEDSLSNRLKKTFGGILGVGASKITFYGSGGATSGTSSTNVSSSGIMSPAPAFSPTETGATTAATTPAQTAVSTPSSTTANTSSSSFFGFGRSASTKAFVETSTEATLDPVHALPTIPENKVVDPRSPVAQPAPSIISSPPPATNKSAANTTSTSSFMSFFTRSSSTATTAPTTTITPAVSAAVSSSQSSEHDYNGFMDEGTSEKIYHHNVATLSTVVAGSSANGRSSGSIDILDSDAFDAFVATVKEDDSAPSSPKNDLTMDLMNVDLNLPPPPSASPSEQPGNSPMSKHDVSSLSSALLDTSQKSIITLTSSATDNLKSAGSSLTKFGGAMLSKLGNTLNNSPEKRPSTSYGDTQIFSPETSPVGGSGASSNALSLTPVNIPSSSSEQPVTNNIDINQHSLDILGEALLQEPQIKERESLSSLNQVAPSTPVPATTTTQGEIIVADKKAGNATVTSSVLYRFPPAVEPPPSEVCDFCLPLGAKLNCLNSKTPRDEESVVQDILFGSSHAKRSSRCFLFVLDDKTVAVDSDEVVSEETGEGLGRLYGICVMLPRLLKTNVVDPNKQKTKRSSANNSKSGSTSTSTSDTNENGSSSNTTGNTSNAGTECFFEFESVVCYTFITRFPLFDFFFQIIFEMISYERLLHIYDASKMADADIDYSRYLYDYLPYHVYDQAMTMLSKMTLPRFNEKYSFQLTPELSTHHFIRTQPPLDSFESDENITNWALPTFLSSIPMDKLVWILSLLLTETKVIVVGHETGMISCAVLGLLAMLRPLEWISPVIPMLPFKLMDFIESPVPIVAGLMLDAHDKTVNPVTLLQRCSATSDGNPCAILDVDHGEVFLPGFCEEYLSSLCLPDAQNFFQRLQESGSAYSMDCDPFNPTPSIPTVVVKQRASYITSNAQKEEAKRLHGVVFMHINAVVSLGLEYHKNQASQSLENSEKNGFAQDSQLISFFDDDDYDFDDDDEGFSSRTNSRPTSENISSKGQALLQFYTEMANADAPVVLLENEDTTTGNIDNNVEEHRDSLVKANRQNSSTGSVGTTSTFSMTTSASSTTSQPFLKLDKTMFSEKNHSKFMKKFTSTQMFREYLDALGDGNNNR